MRMLAATCAAFCLLLAGPVRAVDADAIHLAVADQHLIPAYRRLAGHTAQLNKVVQARCNEGETGRLAMQRQFGAAFLAWQGIQHLRFGPIQVLSRDFRFQLWPDKRGSVGKHLATLLASRDPARLEAQAFAAGSAAVQGFGALERLLFEPPPQGDARDWYCQVTAAVTANLAGMAAATLDEWQHGEPSHRMVFATATGGNPFYDGADELAARLLNNLHTQLERMLEQKLARPLGASAQRAFPKRAEAWRSGLSLAALGENLAACEALYRVAFAARLDDAELDARVTDAFSASTAALGSIDRPLAAAVTDPQARLVVERVRDELATLRALIGEDLSRALELPLGFNSLDGD